MPRDTPPFDGTLDITLRIFDSQVLVPYGTSNARTFLRIRYSFYLIIQDLNSEASCPTHNIMEDFVLLSLTIGTDLLCLVRLCILRLPRLEMRPLLCKLLSFSGYVNFFRVLLDYLELLLPLYWIPFQPCILILLISYLFLKLLGNT